MNINELNDYLQSLPDEILSDAAEIIAETATEYYRSTFRKKAFDGNPWVPAKVPKTTGSLLIDSGAMMNSIRPAVVTPEKVVISAGNDKVDYAQVHNEGYKGPIQVPAHTRRARRKEIQVRAHTRNVDIPQRLFMGESQELNDQIHDRIEGYIGYLNK